MTDSDDGNLVQQILTKAVQLYREADKDHAHTADLLDAGVNGDKFQDANWVSNVLISNPEHDAAGGGDDEDRTSTDS